MLSGSGLVYCLLALSQSLEIVFILLRLLLSPGSLMHCEYIPVVCVPRLFGHDPGSLYVWS